MLRISETSEDNAENQSPYFTTIINYNYSINYCTIHLYYFLKSANVVKLHFTWYLSSTKN